MHAGPSTEPDVLDPSSRHQSHLALLARVLPRRPQSAELRLSQGGMVHRGGAWWQRRKEGKTCVARACTAIIALLGIGRSVVEGALAGGARAAAEAGSWERVSELSMTIHHHQSYKR